MKNQTIGSTLQSAEKQIKAQCAEMGQMLGLDQPVEKKVLLAAIAHEDYAHNLMVSRKSKWFLNHLLNNTPEIPEAQKVQLKSHSGFDLIKTGAKALSKWAMSGFSTVEEAVLAERENACLGCPNLKVPIHPLQTLVSSNKTDDVIGRRTGNSTCNSCGCVVSKKIRLTSESCPEEDPKKLGFTRWGDPIAQQEVSA